MNKNKFSFDVLPSAFFKIWILYIVKCIFTLGIYSFFGKTKIRTYLTNKFSLAGERFVYSGTPKELFYGCIIVFILTSCPLVIANLIGLVKIASSSGDYLKFTTGPFYLIVDFWYDMSTVIVLCIYPCLMLKYRVSRISWKGVNGNLKASVWKYFGLVILSVLTIVSLNIFAPYIDLKRKNYIWNNMHFGVNKFNATAKAMPLMNINIITTILLIPTLGIARLWYYAALDRHVYSGIEINGLKITSIVSGKNLAKLVIGNILLVIFTLGLAIPFIIQRNIKFYIDNHTIIGDLSNLDLTPIEDNSRKIDYSFFPSYGVLGNIDCF